MVRYFNWFDCAIYEEEGYVVATIKSLKKNKLEENMRKRLERGAKKQAAKEARRNERN